MLADFSISLEQPISIAGIPCGILGLQAHLALVRRRTRQGLWLLVETVQSQQAEGTCEVSVALALNGVAVRVQRIDPDTG